MSTWKEQARLLPFGGKRKVEHCGTSASAYINNTPNGVSFHCFRCGTTEFQAHGKLSNADHIRMSRKDEEEQKSAYPEVESLYHDSVPPAARVWVLKAGITPERATDQYGFGWSEKTQRVVVPVLRNGEPTGVWTARDVYGLKGRPKYIMPKGCSGAVWYSMRKDPLVIVEDVLSAIRVSEAGYSSAAVLGTSISLTQADVFSDHSVIGWFDGDKAGRDAFVKLRKAMGTFGVIPARIETTKDPKDYNRKQIKQFIEDTT